MATPSTSTRIGGVLLELAESADALSGHRATSWASSVSIAANSSASRAGMPIFCTISAEEAEHDEATGLVLGDAARLQVEELLVVEAAGGARVTGAADVAGLDLEVRDRLGARAVGQDEVAVRLVRVGADGIRSDEHVADPDAARAGALQRALVEHVARGLGALVVQVDLALEVLARVGVAEAEQLGARAGAGELDARVHAHDAAAEADDDVAEGRVALDAGLVGCRVHGVVVPLLHRDDLEVGAVADDDLDVLRELRRARRGAAGPWRASSTPASSTMCAFARGRAVRRSIVTTIGSSSSASAGIAHVAAPRRTRVHAIAAERSSGSKTSPRGDSPTRASRDLDAVGCVDVVRRRRSVAPRHPRTAARCGRPACASS